MNMDDYDIETIEMIENKNIVMREFINTYETLPELWDSSNPYYMIKQRRNIALEKLLVIYKTIQPDATVDVVRKKLNTLRSNYRKESYPASQVSEEQGEIDDTEDIEEIEITPAISLSSINEMPEIPRKKRKIQTSVSKQNELLSLLCNYFSQSNDLEKYNRSENSELAVVWTKKLDSLQPRQKFFAEKAINDILFEAQLGTLHRNSVKINEAERSITATDLSQLFSDCEEV